MFPLFKCCKLNKITVFIRKVRERYRFRRLETWHNSFSNLLFGVVVFLFKCLFCISYINLKVLNVLTRARKKELTYFSI